MHRPLRLTVDRSALQSNWRWLPERAGVAAGAAVKADGYGLGARETTERCSKRAAATSSCRPGPKPRRSASFRESASLVVLHGVGPDDVEAALQFAARPVPQHARAGRALEGDRARARRAT